MIKYYEGDIFSSNADLICHQVNCQGVFGRGMAGKEAVPGSRKIL